MNEFKKEIMKDKIKNIISNILGLLIIAISISAFIFGMIDYKGLSLLLLVGFAAFLFKVSESRNWLSKIFKQKI